MMCEALKPRAKYGVLIFVSMFLVGVSAFAGLLNAYFGLYYTLAAGLASYLLLSPYLRCLDRYDNYRKQFFT